MAKVAGIVSRLGNLLRQSLRGFPSELETAVSACPDSVGTFAADSQTAD